MKDLKPYINAYISNWDYINNLEDYKWEAIKHFQNTFHVEGSITSRTIQGLSKHVNLLDSQTYYPLGMLIEVSKEKQDVTDKLLTNLFDETIPLKERAIAYMSGFDKLVKTMADESHSDWKGRDNLQSFQDIHAVSVYLALHYPKTHYIYKFSIFQTFASMVEYKRKETGKVDRFIEFYSLCEEVKKELLKEKEFIAEYNKWMLSHSYTDENYNLLTQDFIYAVARYFNNNTYTKSDKKKPIASNSPKVIEASQFSHVNESFSGEFKAVKGVDYAKKDEIFRGIGLLGEEWAVTYEKERLSKLGISHSVIHTSIEEGDGKGYDIESVEDDGITPRYIEVKTTTGGVGQPFYFTSNELFYSELNKEHYYVYRIYNFKSATKQADLLMIHGSLKELNGKPVSYKVSLKE